MREWMKQIPDSEYGAYTRKGLDTRMAMGERPALIVVDVTYGFTGSEGLSFEDSIKEFPSAVAPAGWETMPRIARLIDLFRSPRRPVVFTRYAANQVQFAGNATKSEGYRPTPPKYNDFPPAIMPRDDEFIVEKTKASAFFQTSLMAYLVHNAIDTVVICGVSTSGCVRASVVDAFSNGFRTFVVDDCCFDRSYFAHCANLFDMDTKYSNVTPLEEIEALLAAGYAGKRPAAAE